MLLFSNAKNKSTWWDGGYFFLKYDFAGSNRYEIELGFYMSEFLLRSSDALISAAQNKISPLRRGNLF